ncbi:acetyltransferase [Sporolactobacillus shoreae]|uniref:Acetyltransferase n=1 Tax=Sporolactobacillus shoreae TaxID=1465501 RepID=A0A4Z0GLT7_9BACL|nr:acetyltransferase [Sporolactobacillus shoreae]TGA97408.1 acetyltransferase [Sporolactobacillus shoreae]
MKKIVLIGAGGHCKVIIDLIRAANEFEIVGITDRRPSKDQLLGVPIIGDDEKLPSIFNSGVHHAFICIGALNNMNLRNVIYRNLKQLGYALPILVHNTSSVSKFARIEEGTCIMPQAIVNAGALIGPNCIVNSAAIVEHDCFLEDNIHISPNAALSGGVHIGRNTHMGIGSSTIQSLTIGRNVTVGAGAAVIHDIPNNAVAVGVPAKVIKFKENK